MAMGIASFTTTASAGEDTLWVDEDSHKLVLTCDDDRCDRVADDALIVIDDIDPLVTQVRLVDGTPTTVTEVVRFHRTEDR
jgi:hypothetical protein